jgi:homoserine kinase
MSFVVRAPATTANLGPGFDCAGAALDLWNELHVDDGDFAVEIEGDGADELPRGAEHLSLRAFSLLAPLEGRRFRFVNRIPLERGLGSSAAAVAAGLVAGAVAAGREPDPRELLPLGLELEGHGDNLAAALVGGVCLTWRNGAGPRVARVATDTPLAPIAVVPETRVSTKASRSRLPREIAHADGAAAAAQAALLGAALAGGDPALHASALHDVLHEPYREGDAPLLTRLRADLPDGARGVTLSGSGPTVIVWADRERAAEVARVLESRLDDARVLALRVAEGAHEA